MTGYHVSRPGVDGPPSGHWCPWDRDLVTYDRLSWQFVACPACAVVWRSGLRNGKTTHSKRAIFEAAEYIFGGDPARCGKPRGFRSPLYKWRAENRVAALGRAA